MNLNGGTMPAEEYDRLDGSAIALDLINIRTGMVTPYGVVYDNSMKLAQIYNGRYLPEYYYEPCVDSKINRAGPDGELVISPDEAVVVCWIFERCLDGNSLDKIAAGLEEQGILCIALCFVISPSENASEFSLMEGVKTTGKLDILPHLPVVHSVCVGSEISGAKSFPATTAHKHPNTALQSLGGVRTPPSP